MILTAVVFVAVLSVLVLVHEFGHFIVGKFFGIGVLEFALGLPFTKPLWSRKMASGMKLSLYPLLFGGFVRLLGEEGETRHGVVSGSHFYKANVWVRIFVVVAGVVMNFFLAVALFYVFLAMSNFKVLIPRLADYHFLSPSENHVVVTYVSDNSPAKRAGLTEGDVLLSADGKKFGTLTEFQSYTKTRAGYLVTLSLTDETLASAKQVVVVPRVSPPAGEGPLGLGIADGVVINYESPGDKKRSGLTYALDMLGYNLRVLAHLGVASFKTANIAPLSENVSGPVGIAGAVGTILGLGGDKAVIALFNFVGLLSLSLAFMNVLPIPALDGGRLAFLLVEALFGKRMAAQKENLINQIGMVILLGLIVLISFSDLRKLLTR